MIRLMKNEILKLVKKKSFYVVTFIFILFCILTNIVYQSSFDSIQEEEVDVEEIELENKELDLENNDDLLLYVENLTILKMEELKQEYSNSSADYLIDHFLYNTIYHMYEATYILDDDELAQAYSLQLDEEVGRVSRDDWESFVLERISYLEERIEESEGTEQERYQALLDLAIYRRENKINYDEDSYLNQALLFLEENTFEYVNLLHDDDLSKEEESRLSFLEEEMTIRKYILEHQEDILNDTTLRAVLINFPAEFGLFILIYVIMIAGSIVSEEYTRGTIKYLLVKPFKRRTILTSKLLVVLLMIPVIMLFMSVVEILLGGIQLGFDSLSVPVLLYVDGTITIYSVLGYLASLLLSSLPMYLVIGVLGFMISTITSSTSAAITISFLFYLLGNVISNLALVYDLPIFKGFVSLYWDFSYLVSHTGQPYGASIGQSILIVGIYLVVMLCIAYVTFVKKDVKNI